MFILSFTVISYLIWPRQVNLGFNGIKYTQLDKSIVDNVTLKIEGQINNRYIGVRKFNGSIYCDEIELNGEHVSLVFDDSNKSYLSIANKSGDAANYGEIFTNKDMSELVIVQGDEILVFPSKNRVNAEKIANKYFSIEYKNHFNNIN